jgi:hypothetical protein
VCGGRRKGVAHAAEVSEQLDDGELKVARIGDGWWQ